MKVKDLVTNPLERDYKYFPIIINELVSNESWELWNREEIKSYDDFLKYKDRNVESFGDIVNVKTKVAILSIDLKE